MLVYRVQTEAGRGPYAGRYMDGFDTSMDFQGKFEHSAERQPVEGWDGEETPEAHARSNGNLRYAFKSITQLRWWFDEFGAEGYGYLKRYKYLVAVYRVVATFVWCHDAQVTYDYTEATHVRNEELPCE